MKMKNPIARTVLALALLAAGTTASAATVGHYEFSNSGPNPNSVPAITAAGHTAVGVEVPDAATLAGIDMLFITNGYGSTTEYTDNFAAISAAVNAGMTLVLHDRQVTGAGSLLPGGAGISFFEEFTNDADIDIPVGSPVLSGPGGTLDNSSLDGGNSSSHGYVDTTTLPAGGQVITHRAVATQGVTIAYPYGAGTVIYSTIPLDYYLDGNGPALVQQNMAEVYTPNLIAAYAGDTFAGCAGEGFVGDQLKLCKVICESPLTGKPITPLIRLWMNVYASAPPCATATMPALVR